MNFRPNMCELYPRRRATDYFRTPEPRESIQSRQAEHATQPEIASRNSINTIPPRVQTTQTSEIRFLRNILYS
ncbi:uncharacterized protein LOC116805238 [Drosophila grimshawi]|uniref:uncharacterized protein LOC116805238 n=1 Tax=Drosophila grimshawi TaxID=7222 RepID=UPI000C86E623|nr:uncharacterized protein LOC116805238 [Drosophila grimshawi]